MNKKQKIIVMGAAGRDFHNFNTYFRGNSQYDVVAFTATQIPNIQGRLYPPELSGPLYPKGIQIYPEDELANLIKKHKADHVVFSYSDVSYDYLMERASIAMAAGADFWLLGPEHTSVQAKVPVVSVCAVRTGCGKSQTSRKVVEELKKLGKKVVAVRHPMPYGDLRNQILQRFENYDDLDKYQCTIEEREEYEPYIDHGLVIYSGIDYEKIVRAAEKEADVLVWDGGNNDLPFIRPDLHITVVDPLRAGHERRYYPGEVNFLDADVLVLNKYLEASHEQLQTVLDNIKLLNPDALVIRGRSVITMDSQEKIRDKRVLVIEDGPTITHGEMAFGAGAVAAQRGYAAELVDPRPYAVGSIKEAYYKFPHIGPVLPALGYYPEQLKDLEETINACPCDYVLVASPIDLRRVLHIKQPALRVRYELEEDGEPTLHTILDRFLKEGAR